MASKRGVVSLLSNTGTRLTDTVAPAGVHSSRPDLVELLISCTDLANLDIFSKTDPMCVIFVKQFGQWKELGRTEAVRDQLNPKFTETFMLECDRELTQPLLFSLYDIDSRSMDLRKHDHVGSTEINLTDLLPPDTQIHTTSQSLRMPGDPQLRGWIHVTAELMKETRSSVQLHLAASKLDKAGFFSRTKTDTYIELCRSTNSVDFHPVYKTEVVFKSQNPRWRPFEARIQKLCNNDLDRPVLLKCCHIDKEKEELLIGQVTVTINQLINKSGCKDPCIPLKHPKKGGKKKYKDSGLLRVIKCVYDAQNSVLDFVRGGCSVRFTIAIDFTSSNGVYTEPTSLHNLDGPMDNQYVEAMKTMAPMLGQYDLEQEFTMLGFGAKKSARKKMKDFFPLSTGSKGTPLKGMRGLLQAYTLTVPQLKFSGPSRLAPVINEVSRRVASGSPVSQTHQIYDVLLIITDGVVNDIEATVNALIDSASLPLSVVIVGVGPSDFAIMDNLEKPSQTPLKSLTGNKVASRDNIHFAALRKQKYATGANTALAREALAAVSRQFLACMKSKCILPNRPKLHRMDTSRHGWVDTNAALNDDNAHIDLDTALNMSGPHRLTGVKLCSSTDATNGGQTGTLSSLKVHTLNESAVGLAMWPSCHPGFFVLGPTCPTCGGSLSTPGSAVIDLSLVDHSKLSPAHCTPALSTHGSHSTHRLSTNGMR